VLEEDARDELPARRRPGLLEDRLQVFLDRPRREPKPRRYRVRPEALRDQLGDSALALGETIGICDERRELGWTNALEDDDGAGTRAIAERRAVHEEPDAGSRAHPGARTNSGITAIGRANLDGTGANQTFITGGANPQGVAVDSAHVYWANGNSATIGRANLDGSGANQAFILAGNPQGMAVDSAHVWWANGPSFDAIGQANLDGTFVNQRFIGLLSSPTAVAVFVAAPGPGPGPGPGPPTITRLVADLQQGGLPPGTERSLLAKLGAAQRKLDAGNRQAACGSLGAFGNEADALSRNRLDSAQSAELIAEATAIRQLVGCGAGP
jgi:hypothetical protein